MEPLLNVSVHKYELATISSNSFSRFKAIFFDLLHPRESTDKARDRLKTICVYQTLAWHDIEWVWVLWLSVKKCNLMTQSDQSQPSHTRHKCGSLGGWLKPPAVRSRSRHANLECFVQIIKLWLGSRILPPSDQNLSIFFSLTARDLEKLWHDRSKWIKIGANNANDCAAGWSLILDPDIRVMALTITYGVITSPLWSH